MSEPTHERHWAYYDAAGEIRFAAQSSTPHESLPGLSVIETEQPVDGMSHYVSGGELLEYTVEQAAAKRNRPSVYATWSNDTQSWADGRSLDDIQAAAGQAIDEEAGRARLRYITDVPGQQGVYLRKLEQAQAFVAAGGEGDVPPYIAAEAQATGLDPLPAAQSILAIAAQWDDVLSPAIEQARIGGKRAVDGAADAAAVQSALDTALTTLRSI